jgi:FkbM family methyltransferase
MTGRDAVKRVLQPSATRKYLRLLRIWLKRALYRNRVVNHIYGGIPLKVELHDPDSAGWYDHDWEPLPEIEFLRKHGLKPGARLFDLGAHQGIVAMQLARIVEPGEVIAVEGNWFNAARARRNAELNSLSNLHILHAIAAAEPGNLYFSEGSNASVARGRVASFQVRSVSVDELAREYGRPDVLFVDVEGYELEALKGATDTLRAGADWFIEVHQGCGLEQYGGSVDEVLAAFPVELFKLYFCLAESNEFWQLQHADALPNNRFYLIAISER